LHYQKAIELLPKITEDEKEVLENLRTAPLNETALGLIKRSEPAFQEVRRGASLEHCDWGPDVTKSIDKLTSDLTDVRQLARIGCLRAIYAFRRKEADAAIDELVAVIVMGRHIARRGSFIAKLIQVAIELSAADLAATVLPEQDAETLRSLSRRLRGLQKSSTMIEMMRGEKEFMLHHIRSVFEKTGDRDFQNQLRKIFTEESDCEAILRAGVKDSKGLINLTNEGESLLDELGKILAMGPGQFKAALDAFQTKCATANPVVASVIPMSEKIRYAVWRGEVKLLMLDAAIRIQVEGLGTLTTSKDPFGDGPFEYEPVKGGFRLKSKLQLHDQPLSITVGQVMP
jgi:hypothetical protein